MKVRPFAISIALLLGVVAAFSDDFFTNPVTRILRDGGLYGYLGSSSLIEADRVLSFPCSQNASVVQPADINRLRQEVGEYLYLQAFAIHPESIGQIKTPEGCLLRDSDGAALSLRVRKDSHLSQLAAGVKRQFTELNLWKSFVQVDRLQRDLDSHADCANQNAEYCIPLNQKLTRARWSFPLTADPGARDTVFAAMDQVYSAEGAGTYLQSTQDQSSFYPSAAPIFRAMSSVGIDFTDVDSFWKSSPNAASGVPNAVENLRSSLASLRETYFQSLPERLKTACTADFAELSNAYPLAVRQLLLDAEPVSGSIHDAICASGVLPSIQTPPLSIPAICNGYTESPSAGGTSVHGGSYGKWKTITRQSDGSYLIDLEIPFVADPGMNEAEARAAVATWQTEGQNYYNCLAGNREAPSQVEIPKNPSDNNSKNSYLLHCKPRLPSSTLPEMIFHMKFNLISGGAGGNSMDQIRVHSCWNSDLNSSDCSFIKQKSLESCARTSSDPASLNLCTQQAMIIGQREDLFNWTLDSNGRTVFHELGHALSLNDEYAGADQETLYWLPGETFDDLMRGPGLNTPPILYPRHFEQILEPALVCTN